MDIASVNLFDKILSNYGFGVFMALVFVSLMYVLLRWFKSYLDRILSQNEIREASLLTIIDGANKSLDRHTEQAREFHTQVVIANDYQRKEHERIILLLDEQGKALARQNGYHAGH